MFQSKIIACELVLSVPTGCNLGKGCRKRLLVRTANVEISASSAVVEMDPRRLGWRARGAKSDAAF